VTMKSSTFRDVTHGLYGVTFQKIVLLCKGRVVIGRQRGNTIAEDDNRITTRLDGLPLTRLPSETSDCFFLVYKWERERERMGSNDWTVPKLRLTGKSPYTFIRYLLVVQLNWLLRPFSFPLFCINLMPWILETSDHPWADVSEMGCY
jgi:hypothetical protein